MGLLDTTKLITDLADDLREIQSFDTAAGSYLERCLLEAAHWLTEDKDWSFLLAQVTLSTQDGKRGPYDLPSDFDGLAGEKRLTKYYAYDAFEVDAPIRDGEYGRRFEIYVNRSSGVPLLYFHLNPGTRDLTLTYRKALTSYADLATWPADVEVAASLKKYASFMACVNTPDLQGMAANYKAIAEEKKAGMWRSFRRKSSRPDNRTHQNIYGQALYQDYAGDSL